MSGKLYYLEPESGSVRKIPDDPTEVEKAANVGWKPLTPEQAQAQVARNKVKAEAEAHPIETGAIAAGEATANALTAPLRAAGALAQTAGLTKTNVAGGLTAQHAEEMLNERQLRDSYKRRGMPTDTPEFAADLESFQRRMAGLSEAGGETTAGQVGGLVGGAVGGAPLAIASGGIGGAVTRGLGGAAAAEGLGTLGGLGARAAGAAAGGATIGLPMELASAADEAYQQHRALTGEQATAAALHGLITGSAYGLGFQAVGEGLGAAANKFSAFRERPAPLAAEGEAAAGEPLAAEPGKPSPLARLFGAASGKKAEDVQELTEMSPRGREMRRLAVFEGDETRESAERALRGHVNAMEEATRNLTPEWRELKSGNIARAVDASPGAALQQQELAGNWLATAREKVDEMVADKDVFTDRGAVGRIQKAFNRAEREVDSAIKSGDQGELFTALDGLKKRIGDKSVTRAGQMLSEGGGIDTAKAARGLYDDLRTTLEHPAWGEAGAMQKDVNQAFSEWLGTKKLFDRRFMTETGKEGWERTYGADPGKIAGFVRGLTDPAKDLDHAIIDQHLASTQKLAQALAKAGGTDAQAGELAAVSKAVEGFQSEMETGGQALAAANKLDSLRGGSHYGIGISAAAGHALGGPVGGALGGILGALGNPAGYVEKLATAERLAGKTIEGFHGALDGLLGKVGGAAHAVGEAAPALRGSALELFQGNHGTPQEAYRARVEQLSTAADSIPDRLPHALGTSGITDPALALSALSTSQRAIQYLQQHVPVGLHDPQSLTPQTSKPAPSREDVTEFASIWAAVMKPRDVMAGLSQGHVDAKQMDAIRSVYPQMYGWMRDMALQRVADHDANGTQLTLRQTEILDNAFDLGDAAGPTYSIKFAAKWGPKMGDAAAKSNNAQQQQPKPQSNVGKPLLGSHRMNTRTSVMLGGQE